MKTTKATPIQTLKRRGGSYLSLAEASRARKEVDPGSDLPKGDVERVSIEVWDRRDWSAQGHR